MSHTVGCVAHAEQCLEENVVTWDAETVAAVLPDRDAANGDLAAFARYQGQVDAIVGQWLADGTVTCYCEVI